MTDRITTIVRLARNRERPFRRRTPWFVASVAMCVFVAPQSAVSQSLEPDTLLAHVKYLAQDALAGREAGEPGADSAAAYIERAFERYGLDPLGTDGYRQPFEVITTVAIGDESKLILETSRGRRELKLYDEWLPFSFSDGGRVEGRPTKVGYGLTADVYTGFADGNAALAKSGTPDDFDPHGTGIDPSPRRKATLAREGGAGAILITVSRITVPQSGDPPHSVGIPAVQVLDDPEILDWLRDEAVRIHLDAKVEPVRAQAYNIAGRLPGRDPALADQYLVIGAHYDHLGLGGPGSLSPDVEEPHNGADDNASGTALLLSLAKYFAENPEQRPGRSLAFVAFSAEEMGLIGSEYFVSHPPVRLEDVIVMLNFDMVGRLRDERLQVFGTETAEEFSDLLDALDAESPLELSRVGDGYGPSDQTSFYAREIPVLHFFTGTHSEYHKPEDDWNLINAPGMAEVGELALAAVRRLGDRPTRLTLIQQERPQAGGGGGYGPYLGSIPDFGEVEGGGLRLSGVRAGGPAEKAGLQGGDVVIEFGGKEILNIYDYTYALREHAAGDTVMIKVRRNGEVLELTAVLGKRE